MPTQFHKSRILLVFFVAFLAFFAVAARLAQLQLYQYEKWTKKKDSIQKKTILTRVRRGTIYDRNGSRLAASLEVNSLYVQPGNIAEEEKPLMAKRLSSILDIDQNQVLAKLSLNGFAWIKRKLSDKEVELIKSWITKETGEEDFKKGLLKKGLGFIKEEKRIYPYDSLAAHLTGFVDIDNKGLEGIELSYDKDLKGKPVEVTLIKDGKGNIILNEANIVPPSKGYDLVLTIDKVIQSIAEKELAATCDEFKAKSGTIIAADPQTGQILALANYPTYNLNKFFRYKPDERRNRALTDPFEPGSTFKIITAAAALEEGKVDPEDKFSVPEHFKVANHTFTRRKDEDSLLTFREVIEKSSNIGTIKTAAKLKPEDFYRYVSNFGFGQKVGINLPGENSGKLHEVENWSGTSQATLAIGQGISVTALQMINATMAVANGGKLMKPYLVKKVVDPNGKVVRNYEPEIMSQGEVISRETSKKLSSILEGVVENGTGKKAAISKLRICGKTGTAQKVDPKTKKYSETDYIASFVGFFPADDPKIAILVTIDEPKPIHWGGEVAAPCFKKTAWRIASYLNLLPVCDNPQIAFSSTSTP